MMMIWFYCGGMLTQGVEYTIILPLFPLAQRVVPSLAALRSPTRWQRRRGRVGRARWLPANGSGSFGWSIWFVKAALRPWVTPGGPGGVGD